MIFTRGWMQGFIRGYCFRFLVIAFFFLFCYEFYSFLEEKRAQRNYIPEKTVGSYEYSLCSFSIPDTGGKVPRPRPSCPTQGIVTAFRRKTLATHMWLYATIVATSLSSGLEGFVPNCIHAYLARVFDNLTLPQLGEIGHCILPLPEAASNLDDWTMISQSIVLTDADYNNEAAVQHMEVAKRHFVFNKVERVTAVRHLLRAKRNVTVATYVGVYVGRTQPAVDEEYQESSCPDAEFFVDAMEYFRWKYSNAVFVVVAEKKDLWKKKLPKHDVYIVEEKSLGTAGGPLAVLSHCNHTVLGPDELAVWGAILSGGEVMVSACHSDPYNTLIQSYQNWNYFMHSDEENMNKFPITLDQ